MECDSGDKNRKEQKTRNTKENKKVPSFVIKDWRQKARYHKLA